jgi:hypothetical protein
VTKDEVREAMFAACERLGTGKVDRAAWKTEMAGVHKAFDQLSAEDQLAVDLEPLIMMNPDR